MYEVCRVPEVKNVSGIRRSRPTWIWYNKMGLNLSVTRVLIEFMWFKIRSNGGFLWTWLWTSAFYKRLCISWIVDRLSDYRELYSMETLLIKIVLILSAICLEIEHYIWYFHLTLENVRVCHKLRNWARVNTERGLCFKTFPLIPLWMKIWATDIAV